MISNEVLAVLVTVHFLWASWVSLRVINMIGAKKDIEALDKTIKDLTIAMEALTKRLNLFTTSEIQELKAIGEGIEEAFQNLNKK